MQDTSELEIYIVGRVGRLTLNRPKALNAVNLNVAKAMRNQLLAWQDDEQVDAVLVTGKADRAFCAGGDVKSVYQSGKEQGIGPGTVSAELFRHEYELVSLIASYSKPYVAYLDGITMGTGVGISLHGSHRIASEFTRMAMPETAIGFVPDVGASFFFNQCGPIGRLLALTGKTFDGYYAANLGWATHFLPRSEGSKWMTILESVDWQSAWAAAGVREIDPAKPSTTENLGTEESRQVYRIDREIAEQCFASDELEECLQSLQRIEASGSAKLSEAARECLAKLKKRSPTSLRLTCELLRRGESLSLDECLKMEYRVSQACMRGADFFEGVRAVLVDKDQNPKWQPSSLMEVTPGDVAHYFAPLSTELELDQLPETR